MPEASSLPAEASRSEGTRSELVQAALRLFLERGYAETTIDDVAAAAGYTKGAVYWHFGSKDGLLLEVFEAWAGEGFANLERALREPDPAARSRALDDWHAGDPERSRRWTLFEMELLRLAAESPELAQRLRERQRRVCGLLARSLERDRAAAGAAPGLSSDQLATLLSALSDGLLQQRLVDPDATHGLFARFVEILLPGRRA